MKSVPGQRRFFLKSATNTALMDSLFSDQLPESLIKGLSIKIKKTQGINLGQGIPSFPTSPHIIKAAQQALNTPDIGVYPNFLGTLELRTAIANRHNNEYQINLDEKNTLVTVGAMEATATAILSLIQNNDRVGIITPDYCNHFPQILLARGKTIEIPLSEGQKWQLNLNQIEKEAQKGLKLLIITNPGNPTGFVASKDELTQLVALSNRYGFWILSDETYNYLTYETPATSLLQFWGQSDKLLTVRSFSKEYAMTGWRVGYLVAESGVIANFAKTHDALVGCVPKISQEAALAALTGTQTIVDKYRKILTHRRDRAVTLIGEIPQLSLTPPAGAYYAFARYNGSTPSIELCQKILHEANVAVIPGAAFGKSGEQHIRLSFAVEDEVLKKGISQLKTFFKKLT